MIESKLNTMHEKAVAILSHSYSPYSNFKVGAVISFKNSDQLIAGTNIENASFGATVCAERVAIFNSLTQLDSPQFDSMVLITEIQNGAPPCALCLQVIAEFCDENFIIYLANEKKIVEKITLKDLLPRSFTWRNFQTKLHKHMINN